jgi:hypothetical protein
MNAVLADLAVAFIVFCVTWTVSGLHLHYLGAHARLRAALPRRPGSSRPAATPEAAPGAGPASDAAGPDEGPASPGGTAPQAPVTGAVPLFACMACDCKGGQACAEWDKAYAANPAAFTARPCLAHYDTDKLGRELSAVTP